MGLPCLPVLVTTALTLAGCTQAWLGSRYAMRFAAKKTPACDQPAVTVLKPLAGDEPLLEEALTSFCTQAYPQMQIIFGVRDINDPAAPIVEKLRARFPERDITLVADPTMHGANRKIANLINMFPSAKHDVLVLSDSDMHVQPDFIANVVAALAVPGTGLVTTIYAGRPIRRSLAGLLGAAYITQTFAVGVLMARALGRQDCLGATMALTRQTLMRVGGLPALSPYIADDAVLGMKVRDLGLAVGLAQTVPQTTVAENTLGALFRHELRWARTIRAVAPLGFASSALQYPAFWALLTLLMQGADGWAAALWVGTVAIRAGFGRRVEHALGSTRTPLWMPAIRDVFSMTVLLAAYMGDEVAWRGHKLTTLNDVSVPARLVPARRG